MRDLSLALVLTAASVLAQSTSPYRVTHSFTLGGDGSWDYVVPDPPRHRVFDQSRVCLERRAVQVLARQKQHYEVRR